MTNELPEGLLDVDEDIVEELDAIDDEVVEEAEPDLAAELAQLRTQVASFQNVEGLANDLRRSAGRIQSLEQKLQQESSDKVLLTEEISKQFGGVHELLSTVVNSIDETALDPQTKARVQQAYEASRRAAETASLRKEITANALAELQKSMPQTNTQSSTVDPELGAKAQAIESKAVVFFDALDLNPDDAQFSNLWTEGATLISQGKSEAEVLAHFKSSLRTAAETDQAANRRQRSKNQAGAGSPNPAGTPSSELKYTGDPTKDLKALQDLGIRY